MVDCFFQKTFWFIIRIQINLFSVEISDKIIDTGIGLLKFRCLGYIFDKSNIYPISIIIKNENKSTKICKLFENYYENKIV